MICRNKMYKFKGVGCAQGHKIIEKLIMSCPLDVTCRFSTLE